MAFRWYVRLLLACAPLACLSPYTGAQTVPSAVTQVPSIHGSASEARPITLHVTSRLVLVDVMVTDAKTGMAVGPLSASDFQLEENGVRQKILSLTQDQLPLSIVFMLDLTMSVQPVLHILGNAAEEVLSALRPDDEVAVTVFSSTAKEIQRFTTDRKVAATALKRASRMKSGEATFLNESIFQAAREEGESHNPENRRVIVCLTDGTVNMPSSWNRKLFGKSVKNNVLHTENEAEHELFQTGTSFNAIIERSPLSYMYFANKYAGPSWALESKAHPPGDDHKYARESGGIVLTTNKKDIVRRLELLLTDLRSRYTLAYQPSHAGAAGEFQSIQLSLTPAASARFGKVKLEARKGYIR